MKSPRDILFPILHPTSTLAQNNGGHSGIRTGETVTYLLAFALAAARLGVFLSSRSTVGAWAASLLIVILAGQLFHLRSVVTRALKWEKEKFRALLESASDAIYIIEPSTLRILGRNRRAAEMDGYSNEEIVRMTAADLHPPEDHSGLRSERRIVHTIKTRVRDEPRAVIGLLGVFWDAELFSRLKESWCKRPRACCRGGPRRLRIRRAETAATTLRFKLGLKGEG
jgi:PAS domain-containing protein